MGNIKIKAKQNHLLLEIENDFYDFNLKSNLKKIKSVKVLNVIKFQNKIKITIFPINRYNLEILQNDVEMKLNTIYYYKI